MRHIEASEFRQPHGKKLALHHVMGVPRCGKFGDKLAMPVDDLRLGPRPADRGAVPQRLFQVGRERNTLFDGIRGMQQVLQARGGGVQPVPPGCDTI